MKIIVDTKNNTSYFNTNPEPWSLGHILTLDLGQLGPNQLQVIRVEGPIVYLKYLSTGKEISLTKSTIKELLC